MGGFAQMSFVQMWTSYSMRSQNILSKLLTRYLTRGTIISNPMGNMYVVYEDNEHFIGLAYQGKDVVFSFVIEHK
jgi:hypothetical protein